MIFSQEVWTTDFGVRHVHQIELPFHSPVATARIWIVTGDSNGWVSTTNHCYEKFEDKNFLLILFIRLPSIYVMILNCFSHRCQQQPVFRSLRRKICLFWNWNANFVQVYRLHFRQTFYLHSIPQLLPILDVPLWTFQGSFGQLRRTSNEILI